MIKDDKPEQAASPEDIPVKAAAVELPVEKKALEDVSLPFGVYRGKKPQKE